MNKKRINGCSWFSLGRINKLRGTLQNLLSRFLRRPEKPFRLMCFFRPYNYSKVNLDHILHGFWLRVTSKPIAPRGPLNQGFVGRSLYSLVRHPTRWGSTLRNCIHMSYTRSAHWCVLSPCHTCCSTVSLHTHAPHILCCLIHETTTGGSVKGGSVKSLI